MGLEQIVRNEANRTERLLHQYKLGLSVIIPLPVISERYLYRTIRAYNQIDHDGQRARSRFAAGIVASKYIGAATYMALAFM